jgi:Spy/CpxP family protein refolding chaperone
MLEMREVLTIEQRQQFADLMEEKRGNRRRERGNDN